MTFRKTAVVFGLAILFACPPVLPAQTPGENLDYEALEMTTQGYNDLSLKPDKGVALLRGLNKKEFRLERGGILSMLSDIEKVLAAGKIRAMPPELTGTINKQAAVWAMAARSAWISTDSVSSLSPEEFVEKDDVSFDALFRAVVDEDVSIESSKSGFVNPKDYEIVSNLYSELANDAYQYNLWVEYARNAKGAQLKKAREHLSAVARRLGFWSGELKKLFSES